MITPDNLLVLAIIALAVAFLLRRVWRRLRPRPGASTGGCAGCGGCGTTARPMRSCGTAPRERRG